MPERARPGLPADPACPSMIGLSAAVTRSFGSAGRSAHLAIDSQR